MISPELLRAMQAIQVYDSATVTDDQAYPHHELPRSLPPTWQVGYEPTGNPYLGVK